MIEIRKLNVYDGFLQWVCCYCANLGFWGLYCV